MNNGLQRGIRPGSNLASPYDDEFNDAPGMSGPKNGLSSQWTTHNLATASWKVLDETYTHEALLIDLPSGQATEQALVRPCPGGDFRLTCRMSLLGVSDRQMWGPIVVNSAGTGVGLMIDNPSGDTNTYVRAQTTWANAAGASASISTAMNTLWDTGHPIYMSLRKSGGTYYGAVWHSDLIAPNAPTEQSYTPSAFTPAFIGIGRQYSAAGGSARLAVDFLRVT